ncbi:MAG TPA: family 1 glycosylhydrolase, partial [Polyangiaceae bacterium]|nr:family 1 glycosylhydrolase [Polyangiaceae bacterium]
MKVRGGPAKGARSALGPLPSLPFAPLAVAALAALASGAAGACDEGSGDAPFAHVAPAPGGAAGAAGSGGVAPAELRFAAPGPLATDAGKGAFSFGAATAATQIEDQNPSTDWHLWTAPPPAGLGRGEAFVGDASRGYARALEDVDLVGELGLDAYRFSVEWARVEPARDEVSEAALAHYDRVFEALAARRVRPVLTVHHFSSPVWVDDPRDVGCAAGPSDQNLCGWSHPEGGPLVVAELAAHARLLAARYGRYVDDWATLNEPI